MHIQNQAHTYLVKQVPRHPGKGQQNHMRKNVLEIDQHTSFTSHLLLIITLTRFTLFQSSHHPQSRGLPVAWIHSRYQLFAWPCQ